MVGVFQLRTYTVDEFLNILPELDPEFSYELHNSVIVPMPKASPEHETLRNELVTELRLENRRSKLGLEPLTGITLCWDKGNCRFPDLVVVERALWKTKEDSIIRLSEPVLVAIEIVSTNWQDDYQRKDRWYSGFGVQEYWIIDPMYVVEQYPTAKNPEIEVPTITLGKLSKKTNLLGMRDYEWQSFTSSDRLESMHFPDFPLTVDEMIALGVEA